MSGTLQDQTVVVLGGSAGIGLETARLARADGAAVVVVGRNPERLEQAAADIGAASSAAFDATDFDALDGFFAELDTPVDHVFTTAGGPYYAPLPEFDFDKARASLDQHVFLIIHLAQLAAKTIRPGGSITHMGGTGGRAASVGGFVKSATASLPALTAGLATEIAPVRINLIAAGFVDTPLSASLLGDQLDARRAELRETLPIGRVVEPQDVAALAVHLMENTAVTGATYDIDGGQQLVG
jgi:NAD(P)-dependent dehydrogenase (short-subunit alcohol dehydrogenase family)